jgi:pyridoxine 4-dehydrogenase
VPVACVQNSFCLGHRHEQHEFLRQCGERSVAFVPFLAVVGASGAAGLGLTAAENDEVIWGIGSALMPHLTTTAETAG